MPRGIYTRTKETREKISKALKRKIPWNKGRAFSQGNMMRCYKCKKWKKKQEFYKNPNGKNERKRYYSYCKTCFNKYCNKHQRKQRTKYQMEKRKTDPKFKLNDRMGASVGFSLKGTKNSIHWEKLVGYTLEDLIVHLENQFDNKMNWENYGSYWVIDHIKPKSLFHFEIVTDLEFKKCWSLKNLRPLEKIENLKKGDKLI